jgi:pyruvate formate lyase activating enzyme
MRRELTMVRNDTRAPASGLRVGGLQRLSLVDWPGQLAAVVFCQGCGWRCRYCHNPDLISFDAPAKYGWEEFLVWLERRRRLLDAVVFSGGEPTLQPDLLEAVGQARDLGFKVGLHTAGPVPEKLALLLPRIDWVGFDFKAPFSSYLHITGRANGGEARASLQALHLSRVPCEVRTTWHPSLLSANDLSEMAATLAEIGFAEWVIQRFSAEGCADARLRSAPVGDVPVDSMDAHGLKILVRT